MKKTILSLGIIALLASCGGETKQIPSVTSVSESFHVFGNCGMCEKTIEGSLADIEGVSKADWSKETKQIEVEFDDSKIKLVDIKNKIAEVGYDMEDVRAEESVYSNLPGCCQYDRPGSENKMQMDSVDSHEGHNH